MLHHWTKNDLLVNGVRLHYYRTGHGDKRPLVLVHGFSDNGLCWTPTARDLESEYGHFRTTPEKVQSKNYSASYCEIISRIAPFGRLCLPLGMSQRVIGHETFRRCCVQ